MHPCVTIIMPSLNVVNYIEECIGSALNQTLQNIEILCIDAGSNDGTESILKKYAEKSIDGKQIRLIHSEQKSYGYQVNLGIKEANGEYILVLETDDYIDPEMLEKQYKIAVSQNADMVRSDYISFYPLESGELIETRYKMFESPDEYGVYSTNGQDINLILRDQNIWRGIYKRDFLTRNDIWLNESRGAAYQDIGYMLQCLTSEAKVVYTKDAFYHYRTGRPGSSSVSLNCLKYSFWEFSRFTDDKIRYKKVLNAPGFYYRMMQTFVGEYTKVLKQCGYDPESEYLMPYFIFFRDELKKYLDLNKNFTNSFDIACYTECKELIEDCKTYSLKIKNEEREKAVYRSRMVSEIGNTPIIIWGAGVRGHSALAFMLSNDITVRGFVDNNSKLWKSKIGKYTVYSFDEILREIKSDRLFVGIANKYHQQEIKAQIIEAGIGEDRIILLDERLLG